MMTSWNDVLMCGSSFEMSDGEAITSSVLLAGAFVVATPVPCALTAGAGAGAAGAAAAAAGDAPAAGDAAAAGEAAAAAAGRAGGGWRSSGGAVLPASVSAGFAGAAGWLQAERTIEKAASRATIT